MQAKLAESLLYDCGIISQTYPLAVIQQVLSLALAYGSIFMYFLCVLMVGHVVN